MFGLGRRFLLVALFGAGLCAPAHGQRLTPSSPPTEVRGVVVDAESGEPLPGAHVFISETMVGTTADSTGRFRLTGIRPGSKRLVVSMLGFEAQRIDLFLRPDTTVSQTVSLTPIVLEAPEVVIEGERDEDWYDDLRTFKRLFIGSSELAAECALVNPTVLRFDSGWWKGLEATATAPLQIENRALGYRLHYALKEFDQSGTVVKWDGDPHFEELPPRDSAEAARWQANRRRAYLGSLRHFLQALLDDRLEEAGFSMVRLPRAGRIRDIGRADRFPASRDRIIEGRTDTTHVLDFRGRLEVTYRREGETQGYLRWTRDRSRRARRVQTSWIELNDPPVHVDRYGEIVEPYGATVYGYFAYEQRMSGLLPREYRPERTAEKSRPE